MTAHNELKYTKTHEWCKLETDGQIVTIGITDYAQQLLGELVFVELPEVDTKITQGQEICVVESVKSASDIYAPVTGIVCAVNSELDKSPDLVNKQAQGAGWLFKVRTADTKELSSLLGHDAYQQMCSASVV